MELVRVILCALTLAATALSACAQDDVVSPDDRFAAEASQAARRQLDRLGSGYSANLDARNHLVYVSALDADHLKATAALLAAYTRAQRKTLLTAQPAWNIVIVLPTVEDYQPLAPKPGVVGFYKPAEHAIVSIDRSRILLHEFTHALEHADSPNVNPALWVCEGIASLYESATIGSGGLTPRIDGRLTVLQEAIRNKTVLPLAKLATLDGEAFLKDADLCYAQSRYLMFYLNEKGKLREFYEAYKANYSENRSGVPALEKVLNDRLFNIEEEWLKWALALSPAREAGSFRERLGLEVEPNEQGVRVVSIRSGSAAQVAGRIEVGDVITQFNGRPIRNIAEFMGALKAADPTHTVSIELRRAGQTLTIKQPLGIADDSVGSDEEK